MALVLVYCPTYQTPDGLAIWAETRRSIDQLSFTGEIIRIISDDNPYPPPDARNVLYQYQKARAIALHELADALLTVEHDIIAPPDALQKLWDTGAPVVYGVYLFRHGPPALNTLRYTTGSAPDMPLSRFPDDLARAWADGIANVSGAGFGCTLIRREVLEAIPFRSGPDHPHPDLPFAADCIRAGIRQVAHFKVLCGHICPDGSILWPEMGKMTNNVKVLILQDFNAPSGGHYSAGEQVIMDGSEARELSRGGYVRMAVQTGKSNRPQRANGSR